MSETLKFTPRTELGAEAKEAQERYKKARENLGKLAMESLTNRKANRIRNLGARMVAGSELRTYRKELAKDRVERFNEVAKDYKHQAKEAKGKIKFAKKGYGVFEKRNLVKAEANKLYNDARVAELKAGKQGNLGRGIAGRVGQRLENRANYKNAKQMARETIRSKEVAERAKLEDYRAERTEAKDLRARAKETAQRHKYVELGSRTDIRERAERVPVVAGADVLTNERVKHQLERSAAKHEEIRQQTAKAQAAEQARLEQIGEASGQLFSEDEKLVPNFDLSSDKVESTSETAVEPEFTPDTLFNPDTLEVHGEVPEGEVIHLRPHTSSAASGEADASRKAA